MQSLQNILKTFVKDHGLEGGLALNGIRKKWEKLVGHAITVHTYPDTIKNKILTLIVDTPQWMHHLSFFKEEIIGKLEHFNVSEIRFKLGRLPETAHEKKKAEEVNLTEDDLRYIENTLKNLKDDDLKEKFRSLIAHGLIKGKK
jgi:hypothetical protein